MGYYVNIIDCDFHINKENYDAAYKAVCELNRYDYLKSGGSYRADGKRTPKPADSNSVSNNPDKWFSWMPWNYDETCESLVDIISELGFDVEENEHGICNVWYDSKTGNEETFFSALAPYVSNGSYIVWHGEDDTMWVWCFDDGEMVEKPAYISW